MDSKENKNGFVDWLKSKGLIEISEYDDVLSYFHSRDAGSVYTFSVGKQGQQNMSYDEFIRFVMDNDPNKTITDANQFHKYYKINNLFMRKNDQLKVHVNSKVRDILYNAYMKEVHNTLSAEEKSNELAAIKRVQSLLSGIDITKPTLQLDLELKSMIFDQLSDVTTYLRNKSSTNSPGYSINSIGLAIAVYKAQNFHSLTEEEIKKVDRIIDSYLGEDKDGKRVFGSFIEALSDVEGKYFSEADISAILNGGTIVRAINDGEEVKASALPFFPSDKALTNQVLFHAGGSKNHTGMRILQRVEDKGLPGGYKYTYTKVDGGLNCENVDNAWYSVYTTEVKPKYKKEGDKYVELSESEVLAAAGDPVIYERLIRDTVFMLILTEKQIDNFNKSPNGLEGNDFGEGFAVEGSNEAKEWERLNDIIIKARGEEIPNAKISGTKQRAGNCTFYSPALCFGALVGMDEKTGVVNPKGMTIAADFLQQAKTYKHHLVLNEIYERESVLTGVKSQADALMSAVLRGEKYNNQDPIIYAIENDISLNSLHPIEWVFAQNTRILIDCMLPLAYCLKNKDTIKIHNEGILEYYIFYRLQSKADMLRDAAEAKLDLKSILIQEYKETLANDASNYNKLDALYKLYGDIQFRERRVGIDYESQLANMFDNVPADVIARNFKTNKKMRELCLGICRIIATSQPHARLKR